MDPIECALLFYVGMMDGLLTKIAVDKGWATEMNPLMAAALAHSSLSFMLLKAGLLLTGIAVLWWCRAHRWSRRVVLFGLFVYSALIGYEITAMISHGG